MKILCRGKKSLRQKTLVFFSQFILIADANNWSEKAKIIALASCLRGKARSILDCIPEIEKLSFEELKSKLELRFGEGHLSGVYYTQFINRHQKFGEDLSELGADIERLSRLAYSECEDKIREKIACAQFVNAINNGRAKIIKEINKNSFPEKFRRNEGKFNTENMMNFKMKEKEKNGNYNKNINSYKNKNKFYENKKECWQCGKTGHFRAECPALQEKEN
jgi:hypothetical protein